MLLPTILLPLTARSLELTVLSYDKWEVRRLDEDGLWALIRAPWGGWGMVYQQVVPEEARHEGGVYFANFEAQVAAGKAFEADPANAEAIAKSKTAAEESLAKKRAEILARRATRAQ